MRVKCGSKLGDWAKSGVMLTNESHMWLNQYEENYIYILPLMIQKFEEWRNEKGRNKHTISVLACRNCNNQSSSSQEDRK